MSFPPSSARPGPPSHGAPDLEQGKDGQDHWFYARAYTDPNLDWSYLQAGRDDTVGTFVTLNAERLGDPIDIQLATHLIGDPQFQGKDSMALTFRCRGGFTADGLKVSLTEDDWGPRSRRYTATVPHERARTRLARACPPPVPIHRPGGSSPGRMEGLSEARDRGESGPHHDPPRFARFRWADPKVLP